MRPAVDKPARNLQQPLLKQNDDEYCDHNGGFDESWPRLCQVMDAWSRGPHPEQFWPVHVWQTCTFVLISHTRWKLRWCVQSAARRNIDASTGLIPNGRRTRQSSWIIREATSTGVKHATTILASMLPSGQCRAEMMRQRSFSRRSSRGSGDRLPLARQAPPTVSRISLLAE